MFESIALILAAGFVFRLFAVESAEGGVATLTEAETVTETAPADDGPMSHSDTAAIYDKQQAEKANTESTAGDEVPPAIGGSDTAIKEEVTEESDTGSSIEAKPDPEPVIAKAGLNERLVNRAIELGADSDEIHKRFQSDEALSDAISSEIANLKTNQAKPEEEIVFDPEEFSEAQIKAMNQLKNLATAGREQDQKRIKELTSTVHEMAAKSQQRDVQAYERRFDTYVAGDELYAEFLGNVPTSELPSGGKHLANRRLVAQTAVALRNASPVGSLSEKQAFRRAVLSLHGEALIKGADDRVRSELNTALSNRNDAVTGEPTKTSGNDGLSDRQRTVNEIDALKRAKPGLF